MPLSEVERIETMRWCGMISDSVREGNWIVWRKYTSTVLAEQRLHQLSAPEEYYVREYLKVLADLETNVDADPVATGFLIADWRRRLCAFLGVPPGPEIAASAIEGAKP